MDIDDDTIPAVPLADAQRARFEAAAAGALAARRLVMTRRATMPEWQTPPAPRS